MNYIIYDLEFNQGMANASDSTEGPSLPFEIIQFGALKLNHRLETVSTFNAYVKPTVHKEIHPFIEDLTGINNGMVNSHKYFPEVYKDFFNFTGSEELVLCVWGTVDIKELLRNIKYHQLQPLNFKLFIDVQRYASRHFNCMKGTRIGLKNAVEVLNIAADNKFHHAFNDAFYTAEVLKSIFDETVVPKEYVLEPGAGRIKRPREQLDERALYQQFENMYHREITEEEKAMIKLAYHMGKTRQFVFSKNDSQSTNKG